MWFTKKKLYKCSKVYKLYITTLISDLIINLLLTATLVKLNACMDVYNGIILVLSTGKTDMMVHCCSYP